MTDLVQHQMNADLVAEMDYARSISTGAILPAAYRGKPADILIATGLGKAIGIAPAQALYEIYVVNGRPSPSANLMAALVRRAGHLIRIQGDARSCTATLVRKDDPDFPFAATWTIEQANAAKLTGKDTWKQYPAAMLRARAISEVVRMGASECVLGMDYSREEMQDAADGPTPTVSVASFQPATETVPPATLEATRAAVGPDEHVGAMPPSDVEDAEVIPDDQPEPITARTRAKMFALIAEVSPDIKDDADEQRRRMGLILQREVASRADLSEQDGQTIVDALNAEKIRLGIADELKAGGE